MEGFFFLTKTTMNINKKQLFILFLVYVIIDCITTYQIFIDPELIEINPNVLYLITEFGWIGFIIAKLIVFGLLCGLSILFTSIEIKVHSNVYSFKWAWTALFLLVLIPSIFVCTNNIIVILI